MSKRDKAKSKAGMIVGIVAGVIILLALLGAVVRCSIARPEPEPPQPPRLEWTDDGGELLF